MPADPKMLADVKARLDGRRLQYTEREEKFCARLDVRSGAHKANINVFNTGQLSVGGSLSPLRDVLKEIEAELEAGVVGPAKELPFEIERFPDEIQKRVPTVDPVIVRFIGEAIVCYKADALLAATFMLGAASEKAIGLLIQSYADSIRNDTNRRNFQDRLNGRNISRRYDEFERSYRGCKSRPTESALAQDLETLIGQMFQFCRITRNEVGHPEIVPELVKGAILANLGQFLHYIERVYRLMDHFRTKGVEV